MQFGAGIGMRDRNLNRFDVKFFGELDRVLDRLSRLARQAENEISVHDQAKLVAILGELAGTLDGRALLDVLQDLLIARIRSRR